MNIPLLRAAALTLAVAPVLWSQTPNRTFSAQYSFGDSLSDTGNLFAATSALGAGNPPAPYYQGRFSNGPVWTELLGTTPALAVTAPPSARTSLNFAVGGATAAGSSQLPPSLGVQVAQFVQRGITPAPTDLFTVLAGANDLIPALGSPATAANPATLDTAGIATAQVVAGQVQALVARGARNLVVGGLPNLGRTPRALAAGGVAGVGFTFGNRATTAFNQELRSRLSLVAASAPDVNLVFVDLQGIVDRIAESGTALGFTNTTSFFLAPAAQGGGQGNPNGYVFWDDIHPSARTHALLAGMINEQLNPERALGFTATQGSAALALSGLGSAAFEARTGHLGRPQSNGGAYAGVQYADGERARDAARPGFGYRGQVVLAGADKRLNPGLTLGGALSTGRLSARVDDAGGNFRVQDTGARVYGAWLLAGVTLTADLDYGVLAVEDIRRTTAFGGLATRARTAGDRWGAGLRGAWSLAAGGTELRPWLGLRTHRVTLEAHQEKDLPALPMAYEAQEANSTAGSVGLDASWATKLDGRGFRFDLRGAWHEEISPGKRSVTGRLADNFTRPATIYTTAGDGGGLELGAAATLALSQRWSASLSYNGDIRPGERLASRAAFAIQTGF